MSTSRAKRLRIYERDGFVCRYCAKPVKDAVGNRRGVKPNHATLDHIIPRSRGGTGDESNLVTACFSCNSRKKDRTRDEYLGWHIARTDSEETRL